MTAPPGGILACDGGSTQLAEAEGRVREGNHPMAARAIIKTISVT
jgi:hypothetical protein